MNYRGKGKRAPIKFVMGADAFREVELKVAQAQIAQLQRKISKLQEPANSGSTSVIDHQSTVPDLNANHRADDLNAGSGASPLYQPMAPRTGLRHESDSEDDGSLRRRMAEMNVEMDEGEEHSHSHHQQLQASAIKQRMNQRRRNMQLIPTTIRNE